MNEKKVKNITCTFANENSLYLAYMPFIINGGLFIRTNENYEMGDLLELEVFLPSEKKATIVEGKVVWISPKGDQAQFHAGIGAQFQGDRASKIRDIIETRLAGSIITDKKTDTM